MASESEKVARLNQLLKEVKPFQEMLDSQVMFHSGRMMNPAFMETYTQKMAEIMDLTKELENLEKRKRR